MGKNREEGGLAKMDWLIIFGVPSAVTGVFFGIMNWKIQRTLNKQEERRKKEEEAKEKKAEEREKDRETLIMMQLQSANAAVVLSKATARAVQRIPDAKCNGDMTKALEYAQEIQNEQKQFLFEKGIHSLYVEE